LAEGARPPVEHRRNEARATLVGLGEIESETSMTDDTTKQSPPSAPTLSADPERELELKLKKHPEDKNAKVDVGSDESMDASDPPAATQPGQNDEPVPSSSFPG